MRMHAFTQGAREKDKGRPCDEETRFDGGYWAMGEKKCAISMKHRSHVVTFRGDFAHADDNDVTQLAFSDRDR